MREILAVGLGGFVGAVSRYLISSGLQRFAGAGFPWGTWVVNVAGCLAIGAVAGMAETRAALGAETRLFLAVGLLGSLTTFSAFGNETVELLRRSELGLALANVAANVLLGVAAVYLGRAAVRGLLGCERSPFGAAVGSHHA